MKKSDHEIVIKDFQERIEDLFEYLGTMERYIRIQDHPTKKEQFIAEISEQVFISMAAAFEKMITDLFLTFINSKSQQFISHKRDQLTKHINEFKEYSLYMDVNLPKNLNMQQVINLVTPDEDNIKFGDVKALQQKAKQWLVNEHRKRFTTLHNDDVLLINAMKKIRNYLAHRSSRSLRSMIELLKDGNFSSPNSRNYGLGINVKARNKQIGVYLKAYAGDFRRIEIFFQRIHAISGHFKLNP